MNDQKSKQTFSEQEDAEQGFPRYREYIGGLPFKKKVIEFLNVACDRYVDEKQDIIYDTFTLFEREKYRNQYEDIVESVKDTYNLIVEQYRTLLDEQKKAESDIREVFVFERNINWINSIIRDLQESLNQAEGHEHKEDIRATLDKLKSYNSPVVPIRTTFNEETGRIEVNFEYFERGFKLNLQNIENLMSNIKALFISIRSFLEEIKRKDFYPKFAKNVEQTIKDNDIIQEQFSSTVGNQIRKKTKNSRTPDDDILLLLIETNERRGYTFPDYSKIEPEKNLTSYCMKEWKNRTRNKR